MRCVILAGGFATRLWPLSEKRAKPMLHLKDRPLLAHITDNLPADIPVIISVNEAFADGIKAWAARQSRPMEVMVESARNDEGKLGALAAVARVIETAGIDEELLLVAGDNYFGFRMADFLARFQGNPLLAAFDIKDKEAAKKFGVVLRKDGRVTGFQEKPEHPESTLVSTGCYLFPRKNLPDIVEFAKEHNDNLGGIFEHLLKKGETVDVFGFSEGWYDIGSFEAYLQANADLLGGAVIKETGVTDENNRFENGVFIGANTRLKDSIIDNCVILNDCVIEDCVLRNCVVDEKCRLKGVDFSHQMIRAGSKIEKE